MLSLGLTACIIEGKLPIPAEPKSESVLIVGLFPDAAPSMIASSKSELSTPVSDKDEVYVLGYRAQLHEVGLQPGLQQLALMDGPDHGVPVPDHSFILRDGDWEITETLPELLSTARIVRPALRPCYENGGCLERIDSLSGTGEDLACKSTCTDFSEEAIEAPLVPNPPLLPSPTPWCPQGWERDGACEVSPSSFLPMIRTGAPGDCFPDDWPQVDAPMYPVLYVRPGGTGDGSLNAPLGSLSEALSIAQQSAGTTIVLHAGLYAAEATLDRPVELIGAGTCDGGTELIGGLIFEGPQSALRQLQMSAGPSRATAIEARARGELELESLRMVSRAPNTTAISALEGASVRARAMYLQGWSLGVLARTATATLEGTAAIGVERGFTAQAQGSLIATDTYIEATASAFTASSARMRIERAAVLTSSTAGAADRDGHLTMNEVFLQALESARLLRAHSQGALHVDSAWIQGRTEQGWRVALLQSQSHLQLERSLIRGRDTPGCAEQSALVAAASSIAITDVVFDRFDGRGMIFDCPNETLLERLRITNKACASPTQPNYEQNSIVIGCSGAPSQDSVTLSDLTIEGDELAPQGAAIRLIQLRRASLLRAAISGHTLGVEFGTKDGVNQEEAMGVDLAIRTPAIAGDRAIGITVSETNFTGRRVSITVPAFAVLQEFEGLRTDDDHGETNIDIEDLRISGEGDTSGLAEQKTTGLSIGTPGEVNFRRVKIEARLSRGIHITTGQQGAVKANVESAVLTYPGETNSLHRGVNFVSANLVMQKFLIRNWGAGIHLNSRDGYRFELGLMDRNLIDFDSGELELNELGLLSVQRLDP